MSFTFTAKCPIKCSVDTIRSVCAELGLTMSHVPSRYRLFESIRLGYRIQLPGWKYDVVLDTNLDMHYDNHDGNWGNKKELDRLVNRLTVEPIRALAERDNIPYKLSEVDGEWVLDMDIDTESDAATNLGITAEEAKAWA